ncbi:MAG: dienelactone hydrolase family protein [Chitinophagaceae bacterium]
MKKQVLSLFTCLSMVGAFTACNEQPAKTTEEKTGDPAKVSIKGEEVIYKDDTLTLNGYVAYNENDSTKRPAVLVVPEWWGVSDYTKGRARQLAELGYVAMAVDMYGNGIVADSPALANSLAKPFYTNPQMAKARIDAALAKLKTYNQVDTSRIAAIGYCFGGAVVLNVARLGEDLKGVVSFHGNLIGVPAKKELLKAKILVCHGAADPFVPQKEVEAFKKQMDSIGADYTFKAYDSALHAFTNPAATEKGKKFNLPIAYNAAADTASWKDMKDFFDKIFK